MRKEKKRFIKQYQRLLRLIHLKTKRLRRKISVQFSSVGDVHVHFSSPHWLMTCSCSNCTDTLQLTCDLRQLRESTKNLNNASVLKIRKKNEHCSYLANSFNLETASHRWIFWQIWCWYQSPPSCAKKPLLELSLHRISYPHFSWEGGGKRLRKIHVGLI